MPHVATRMASRGGTGVLVVASVLGNPVRLGAAVADVSNQQQTLR